MSQENATWLRPQTTRRYLHPPKAERMYTIWTEGKLISGEIIKGVDWRSYQELDCCGAWMVHGEKDLMFDFHQADVTVTDDGTPFHGLTFQLDGLEIRLEALCDIARKPTCFGRLTCTNRGKEVSEEKISFFLRSGKEQELVFGTPDEYVSYAPDVEVWKNASKTWEHLGETFRDGENFFSISGPGQVQWDASNGAVRLEICLAPNTSAEYFLVLGRGDEKKDAYQNVKQAAQAYWDGEFHRLTKLPKSLTDNPDELKMVRHLTAQLLQCFCYPVSGEELLARQGGMQRLIWPWESTFVLEALGKLGNFADYIEPVLQLYFDGLQTEDGEIRPVGENWACITGSALYSFAKYCMDACPQFYQKYRDKAMQAFSWIRKTRASTQDMPDCVPGLFPPMRGCDWFQEFQCWVNTDIYNLQGLKAFAEATAEHHDPSSKDVMDEYNAYFGVMRSCFAKFQKEAESTGELRIPLTPDGNDQALIDAYYPYLHHGAFVHSGVVEPEDIRRIFGHLVQRGIIDVQHNLYGHMPYEDGNLHVWYTTYTEYYWFFTWLGLGERKRAQDMLESQLRYSMTPEYYMIERYQDNDPYYVPWSPNASANARVLQMLLCLREM